MADHSLSRRPAAGSLNGELSRGDLQAVDSPVPALESPADPRQSLTLRFFRPLPLAKLAFAVGLVVFFPYLIQRLPNLSARPEYRLSTKEIRLVPAPERPIPVNLLEQIRLQNHLPRELSLLDPGLCEKLGTAFARHPWVARVVSVQKSFPAQVTVTLEYRRPVAMVQVKGGRIPIDAAGTVLPSEDFGVADVVNYPTIRQAGSSSLVRQGGRFKHPGLYGAVQLAELLGAKWNSLGLEAIELPRIQDGTQAADDIQLQLQAKVGSSILWGRAPGTDHPGELTAEQKVARLEKYLSEFGAFDRPNGPYEIDIRHWQEITRRPAAKDQTSLRREARSRH